MTQESGVNSLQGKPVAASAPFNAATMRALLPDSLTPVTPGTPLAEQLDAYQRFYGLAEVAASADYRIGHLHLAGSKLVVQHFGQPEASHGTVVLVHGYTDHGALYRHLVSFLFERGWDLLLYDLPGHGLSAGEPLSVDSFFHYADQLAALLREEASALPAPLALAGHSTGAAILTTLLVREPALRDGLRVRPMLLAPLLRPTHWRSIHRKYRWLHRWLKRVRRAYQQNTHDPEFLAFLSGADPLQHGYIPVKWVGAMLEWIAWVEQQTIQGVRPLIVQGTEDTTVEWQYNLPVFERIYGQAEVVLIEQGRHNLVNEAPFWRDRAFAEVLRVLEEAH